MPFLQLDVPTLIAVFIVGNLLVAALMLVAFRGRRDIATNLWTGALTVQAIGWCLLPACGSRRAILGFILVGLSHAMMLAALARHFGVSQRYAWPYWPMLLVCGLFLLTPTIAGRQLGGSLISALQVLMTSVLVLTHRDRRPLLRLMIGGAGALGAGVLLVRAFDVATNGASCISESSPTQGLSFLLLFVFRFSVMFGFILLIEGRHQESMVRLAALDPLTGAFNRRTFIELAEKELQRSQRNHHAVSLILFDLDHFKQVNDTRGHLVGDHVLCQVKAVAQSCLRGEDLFARYGGEEFVLLAPETGAAGAFVLAERLRAAIAAGGLQGVPVTASMGVASVEKIGPGDTLEDLLARADAAMYRAKAAGRNRVEMDVAESESAPVLAA